MWQAVSMRRGLFDYIYIRDINYWEEDFMWTAKSVALDHHVHKLNLFEGEALLSYEAVINYWFESTEFRNFYFSVLSGSPFDAFFWEHPPLTNRNIKQDYEFVLVHSPQLSKVSADPSPFREKFKSLSEGQTVLAFENLGGDAELIVPYPVAHQYIYAHLASFIRKAPESQRHDLFITMTKSLKHRINNSPTWLSTSGLGVYWLHIRLDSNPKYYSYQPYRHYLK